VGGVDGLLVGGGRGWGVPEEAGSLGELRRTSESEGILADGAYDSKAYSNFHAKEGIKPVIRVRKGSAAKSKGSYSWKKAVMEQQAFRPRSWSRIHRFGYGRGGGSRVPSQSSTASSGSTSQQGSSSIWRRRWR